MGFKANTNGMAKDEYVPEDKGNFRKRVTFPNKYLKDISVEDPTTVLTDDALLVIDADTIPYMAASKQDENYVLVSLVEGKEGFEPTEFKNKTAFKGASRTGYSAGSFLDDLNLQREVDGLELFSIEDFVIEAKQRLAHPEEKAKKYVAEYMEDYIESMKVQTTAKKVLCLMGSGDNHRHDLHLPELYKDNRSDTLRPILLSYARELLADMYDTEIVEGIEADDKAQQYMWEGYLHYIKHGKFNKMLAAIDKDARSCGGGLLFNYTRKGIQWDNCLPWLFCTKGGKAGDIEIVGGKVKVTGHYSYAWQMLCGDSADHYHPYRMLPKEMKAGLKYGDATFYKDFAPLKTAKEVYEKVVDKFAEWFPKGLKYESCHGSKMSLDTFDWASMLFTCVHMLRKEGDDTSFKKVCDIFKVDYSVLENNYDLGDWELDPELSEALEAPVEDVQPEPEQTDVEPEKVAEKPVESHPDPVEDDDEEEDDLIHVVGAPVEEELVEVDFGDDFDFDDEDDPFAEDPFEEEVDEVVEEPVEVVEEEVVEEEPTPEPEPEVVEEVIEEEVEEVVEPEPETIEKTKVTKEVLEQLQDVIDIEETLTEVDPLTITNLKPDTEVMGLGEGVTKSLLSNHTIVSDDIDKVVALEVPVEAVEEEPELKTYTVQELAQLKLSLIGGLSVCSSIEEIRALVANI